MLNIHLINLSRRSKLDIMFITLIISLCALFFALILSILINKKSSGTDRMKEISHYIQEGAMAYLIQQYKVVGISAQKGHNIKEFYDSLGKLVK